MRCGVMLHDARLLVACVRIPTFALLLGAGFCTHFLLALHRSSESRWIAVVLKRRDLLTM